MKRRKKKLSERGDTGNKSMISDITQYMLEIFEEDIRNKRYNEAPFIDITKTFDKIRHEGLLYKIKTVFADQYYQFIKSY